MFYQLPDDSVFKDEATPSLPKGTEWMRLFEIGPGPIYRVAPIFPDAGSAVRWLRAVEAESRKYPGYTRKVMPSFVTADPLENFVGLGPNDNYGPLASDGGAPLPTFLYRGQENPKHPPLPTLGRCLWPPIALGKGEFSATIDANHAEQKCTSYFTKKFFGKWSLRWRFKWMRGLSVPIRAAIARHYGFYSWILDSTLEPGIAAWFATGGVSSRSPTSGLGSIQYVDEHYLSRVFGESPTISNHAGYQQRSWDDIDMQTVLRNTTVSRGGQSVGALIAGQFWTQAAQVPRALEKFCCRLHYVPGLHVDRMWHQKWCGVEAHCEESTWGQMVTAYQVLARITGSVLFRHTGKVYEEPEANISTPFLLCPDDEFSSAVEEFKRNQDLNPGSFTREFLNRLA